MHDGAALSFGLLQHCLSTASALPQGFFSPASSNPM